MSRSAYISSGVFKTAHGFTLLEVLIALVVTSIGLLGIAKMQALAYASTGTASSRSLIAMETAGLASMMRANRIYWGGSGPSSWTTANVLTVDISGGVVTISDSGLNTTAASSTFSNNFCAQGGGGAPCSNSATLAASDLHMWADGLMKLMPGTNIKATVTCPAGVTPINCTIQVGWSENTVGINAQSVSGATNKSYLLYVEP